MIDADCNAHDAPGRLFETADHHATGQQCLKVRRGFAAGEVVTTFAVASRYAVPAGMTMQVSERDHIRLEPAALALTNHGCDPNVAFDVEGQRVVALRDIAAGDELTYFYPATEWEMAEPFECTCGAARCLGTVGGAAMAPAEMLAGQVLAPHVRRLLASQKKLESQDGLS